MKIESRKLIFSLLFVSLISSLMLLSTINTNLNLNKDKTPNNSQFNPIADYWDYDENLDIFVEKSGDLFYQYSSSEQGIGKIYFPISLDVPLNKTYDNIIDAAITLDISQIEPQSKNVGPIVGGQQQSFGLGYFSHVYLSVILYIENPSQNATKFTPFVNSIVGNLSQYLNTELYLDNNYTGGGGINSYWESTYIGFPSDYDLIWANILDDTLPMGEGLLNFKEEMLSGSKTKLYRIQAGWDEKPNRYGQTGIQYLDERWEFGTAFIFEVKKGIEINYGSSTTVNISELIEFEDELNIQSYINQSTLNIYLYHGAEITSVYPIDHNEDNEYGRVFFDLVQNHQRRIINSDRFTFNDNKLDEPILKIRQYANITQVDTADHIEITYKIENIGDVKVFNVEVDSELANDIGQELGLISGVIEPTIDELEIDEIVEHSFVINCSSDIQTENYWVNVQYDALLNNVQDQTWKNPSIYDWDHYYTSGNELIIRQNEPNYSMPMLIMDIDYNTSISVGDNVTFYGTIENIDDYNASDVSWWMNNDNLGYNNTPISGTFDLIEAGETVDFQYTIQIDSNNRGLGEFRSSTLSMQWYNGTGDEFDNLIGDDCFHVLMNIHPDETRVFGPLLTIVPTYSISNTKTGGILEIDVLIKNEGDRNISNVFLDYDDGTAIFSAYGGHGGGINFGLLEPGEEYQQIIKLQLLQDFENKTSLQLRFWIQYHTGDSWPNDIDLYTYQYLYEMNSEEEGKTTANADTIIISLIIALVAVSGIAIGEFFYIYQKNIKPFT